MSSREFGVNKTMTPKTIKKYLARLRKRAIESDADWLTARIAYAMETAIRRVTEPVYGWSSLEQEAADTAKLIRQEIEKGKR